MDCEKRSDKRSAPKIAGDLAQPNEKQERSDRVQQDICEMVAARFEIENLAIDHVGDEGERMPVVGLRVGKGPGKAVQTQTFGD